MVKVYHLGCPLDLGRLLVGCGHLLFDGVHVGTAIVVLEIWDVGAGLGGVLHPMVGAVSLFGVKFHVKVNQCASGVAAAQFWAGGQESGGTRVFGPPAAL